MPREPAFVTARRDATAVALPPGPLLSDALARRLYAATTQTLKRLVRAGQKTLRAFGCGDRPSRELFRHELRRVLVKIRDAPSLPISASSPRELIQEVLRAFGASEVHGREMAQRVLVTGSGQGPGVMSTPALENQLFADGLAFYRRLDELERLCFEPYRDGDQMFALLAQFPDLADDVYAAAGIVGLSGFPPTLGAGAGSDARSFALSARAWEADRNREGTAKMIGLVIAGVVVGIVSFGTLSSLSATLVTAGFGLAQGTAAVVDRSLNHRETLDAYAIGAASGERLEFAGQSSTGRGPGWPSMSSRWG